MRRPGPSGPVDQGWPLFLPKERGDLGGRGGDRLLYLSSLARPRGRGVPDGLRGGFTPEGSGKSAPFRLLGIHFRLSGSRLTLVARVLRTKFAPVAGLSGPSFGVLRSGFFFG